MQLKSIRANHRMALAVGVLSLALAAGLTSTADAGRYSSGGDKGGGAGSARYDKYLEEEAKREQAKAAEAHKPPKPFQQAGDLPAVTGQGVGQDAGPAYSKRRSPFGTEDPDSRGR